MRIAPAVVIVALLIGVAREHLRREIDVPHIKSDDITTKIYHGVVWLGFISEGQITRLATGWCVAQKDGYSYIVTASHVVAHGHDLIVGHWPGSGSWKYSSTKLVGYSSLADVALLKTSAAIVPLPLAERLSKYEVGDEVLIVGSHPDAAPAIPSHGYITSTMPSRFVTNAWAWYGHSGGPAILRRTNRVIGILTEAEPTHPLDGSLSICADFTSIRSLLASFDIHP